MIDKETFLKACLPETQVDLHGQQVTVRGLSRAEVVSIQKYADDLPKLEAAILVFGFVDPPMTPADVEAWYGAAPAGDTDKVIGVISDLSGMAQDAPKSRVSTLRGGPPT